MFVGFEPDISQFIGETKIILEEGEVLVLYTDGMTDAINGEKEEFGLERLCELVKKNHDLPSAIIVENVLEMLKQYIGKAKVYDDISLMVIKQK